MLLGRQNELPCLCAKKGEKGNAEVRCSSRSYSHCSVMPALGDVYRHREMMTKCSSPNINTTAATDVNTDSIEPFPSDEAHVSCVWDGAKTPSGERKRSDASFFKLLLFP